MQLFDFKTLFSVKLTTIKKLSYSKFLLSIRAFIQLPNFQHFQFKMLSRSGNFCSVVANGIRQNAALSAPLVRNYHEKVLDHYEKPRNVGSLDKNDKSVGTGLVGAPACGDVMRLQIKVYFRVFFCEYYHSLFVGRREWHNY